MREKIGVKKIITIIAIIFASIYLTFLIDAITLNTNLKRIFIFCYFLVVSKGAVYLKKRYLEKKNTHIKEYILSIIIAIALLVGLNDAFIPISQDNTISLVAEYDEKIDHGQEVWLTKVIVDGVEKNISELYVEENVGWIYNADYDDYVFYPKKESNNNILSFNVPEKNFVMEFSQNVWSGKVEVIGKGFSETLDLYREDGAIMEYNCSVNSAESVVYARKVPIVIGAVVMLAFFVYILIILISQRYITKTGNLKEIHNISLTKRFNKRWFFLAIVIIIIFRIMCQAYWHPYVIYPDSYSYMEYPWSSLLNFKVVSGRTPLYPALISTIEFLSANVDYKVSIVFVQTVLHFVSIFFLYRTIEFIIGYSSVACIIAVAYGTNLGIIVWDYSILTESVALDLTVIFIFFMIRYIAKPTFMRGIIINIVLFIAIFVRPTFLLFYALVFCFWVFRAILYAQERKILYKVILSALIILIFIGIYAQMFKDTFGYYSISDAMPRQNVVTVIFRGYYKNPVNKEFSNIIEESLKINNGDVWITCGDVLNQYGLIESNKIAKEILFYDIKTYIRDTVRIMKDWGNYNFCEYYFNQAEIPASGYILSNKSIKDALFMRIDTEYKTTIGIGIIILFNLMFRKKIYWEELGVFLFLFIIPISSFVATCGEFDRTMIHCVPFIYVGMVLVLKNVLVIMSRFKL